MIKCRQCNVTISDNTAVCPLCQCVVEVDEPATVAASCHIVNKRSGEQLILIRSPVINEYPAVWLRERKIKRACSIILLAVLGASAVIAAVNFMFSGDSLWCIIPIAAMMYGYLAFRSIFVSRKDYRWKVLVSVVCALILMLIIDIETGFYRWSLNFVMPGGVLIMDLVIVILMLTYRKNWQSYMIIQIVMMVVSLIPIVLWAFEIVTSPLLSVIAAGVSVFMFLGALILGDRTARSELHRRFHIR